MKAITEVIKTLESLKGKMCLRTSGELYRLESWDIEHSKSLFGNPYDIITKLWFTWSRHIHTEYQGTVPNPDKLHLHFIENDRLRFIKMKQELKIFNYEITKIENNVTH